MRCGTTLLMVALLVAVRAEALLVEDEYEEELPVEDAYEKALQDKERRTECEDCPRCPPPPANCTFLVSSQHWGNFYNVDGVKLKIKLSESHMNSKGVKKHVKLACPPGVTLKSASLPVFPTPMRVSDVTLTACPAPRAAGGISRALSRLNIIGEFFMLEMVDVPPPSRLHPDLFAGLQRLRWLYLSAEAGLVLEPLPGLLEPLKELKTLHLLDVRMSLATLEQLPRNLLSLYLMERSTNNVDYKMVFLHGRLAAALDSTLEALEPHSLAPRLKKLDDVTLTATRGSCSALQRLHVSSPLGTAALPAGWLRVRGKARCPRLSELCLYSCALGGLPVDTLRNLTELRELAVTDCRGLRALPRELFSDTRGLRRLVLKNNALMVLPEGIFAPLRELEELDLSGNMLGALGDGAVALNGVRSLTSLKVLLLDYNPLNDTCGNSSRDDTLADYELSPLHELRVLQQLSLAHTGASRLCVDWRRDLNSLSKFDFSYNKVTVLKYSDMQWYGGDCQVELIGNPLRDVIVTSEDYLSALEDQPFKGRAVLEFYLHLASSCHTYWAARIVREGRLHTRVDGLRVRVEGLTWASKSLADEPVGDMTCVVTHACPACCVCSLHTSVDTLVLRCATCRDLPDLAPVAKLAQHFELRLEGAPLASLPDALPASLRVLDLRNASLPAATENQAAMLFADGRHVLLDGARVSCACAGGARPALTRVLVAQRQDVRCAEDGRRVREAPPCARVAEPGLRGAWAGALGALAVAALVLAGAWCAAQRLSRLRVKVFLLLRDLCAAWTHSDVGDHCPYDVFFWFSRHDFAVASQIVRELEAGPRPLRVCVHYRDWRAGESILAQIQRSVVQSRRTLVLVSGHVARSVWARAVLREAAARALRDVTPRLVLALLPPAPPPAGDPELAHYVRANTYARWGDGAFWDRLRLALPPGRTPNADQVL